MSQSPTSEHRARLIREMARDLNKTRHSAASSRTSSVVSNSDFNQENDVPSTRQLDQESQPLPDLRARYTPDKRPDTDFVINTSAIGRAFPDFTEAESSSDGDDGSSISIELGRGVQRNTGVASAQSKVLPSKPGSSMDFSPAEYHFKVQPNRLPSVKHTSNDHGNSLRRDAQVRRASNVQREIPKASPTSIKATDYGSAGSRHSSAEGPLIGRNLHPTVEDLEFTNLSDERPSTTNLTTRSTRFGTAQAKAPSRPVIPSTFTSTKDFLRKVSYGKTSTQRQRAPYIDNGTLSSVNAGTQQSFMIPNLPNMSELVSGIFEDGTPVFSRHGPARVAPSSQRKSRFQHAALSAVSVPGDEEAIFMSLKLLQDKVTELESQRSEAQITIRDLREKTRVLEDEKASRRRSRKSDSALGSTSGSDAGDDIAQGSRKAVIEKNRLESMVRSLQDQAKELNHKNAVAEVTIKNLTKERDSAVAQLGVAFITTEQLKAENKTLVDENDQLRVEITSLRAGFEEYLHKAKADALLTKSNATEASSSHQETTGSNQECQILNVNPVPRPKAVEPAPLEAAIATVRTTGDGQKRRKRRVILEEYSDSDAGEESKPNVPGTSEPKNKELARPVQSSKSQEDKTGYSRTVSFLNDGDITMLRKILEQDHVAGKAQIFDQERKPAADISQSAERVLPRKSSMKDMTGRLSHKAETTTQTDFHVDETTHPKVMINEHSRHRSETEQRRKRRGIAAEDMTSAFILPDVTMRQPREATTKEATGTETLDQLAKHDGENCTICKRIIKHGETHIHAEKASDKVRIPKPIPVSDRIKDIGADSDDHTIRPSEPPATALAAVIKGLEDEFAHLGMQLIELQAVYTALDPSLQKRKRKILGNRMDNLRLTMDAKGDQVYALYDVLEGQKKDGHEMSEKEVETTLQSVGIEFADLGLRAGIMFDPTPKKKSMGKKAVEEHPWDDLDDAGDLSWQGFDTTGDVTGKSRRSASGGRQLSAGA